jgi:hypothetical protein
MLSLNPTLPVRCVISRVGRQVDAVYSLLECYASYSGNSLLTIREGLTFKDVSRQLIGATFKDAFKVGPMGCPETSVRN